MTCMLTRIEQIVNKMSLMCLKRKDYQPCMHAYIVIYWFGVYVACGRISMRHASHNRNIRHAPFIVGFPMIFMLLSLLHQLHVP